MSAFLVSKKHIDALVFARSLVPMHERCDRAAYLPELDDNELGKLLWTENVKSLKARYNPSQVRTLKGDNKTSLYKYEKHDDAVVFGGYALGLIKLIRCYQYQSCEHNEWTSSKAHAYCELLESRLVDLIPGYAEAPREI